MTQPRQSPSIAPSAAEIPELCRAFNEQGFVVLRGVLDARELTVLQDQTAQLIRDARRGGPDEEDYFFTEGGALHRIQYIFPKASALLTLLAHPRLYAVAAGLLGGELFCAGEALVFKATGNGVEVPVHRDFAEPDRLFPADHLCFNIDVYLDQSTVENGCLEVVPGSHREAGGHAGFATPGLVPVPMAAGDVIFHHIALLHGSRHSRHPSMRRTLYYEFHGREQVRRDGLRPGEMVPPGWIENRMRILDHSRSLRRLTPWGAEEIPIPFQLPGDVDRTRPLDLRPRLGWNKFF